MRYIDNKGQTLVVFIIMLPIILIIFTLVIDLGLLYINKRNIENNVSNAIGYYLKNMENPNAEVNMTDMINRNVKNIDKINVNNTLEYIEVNVIKENKSLYNLLKGKNNLEVIYKGYKESKKIIKG